MIDSKPMSNRDDGLARIRLRKQIAELRALLRDAQESLKRYRAQHGRDCYYRSPTADGRCNACAFAESLQRRIEAALKEGEG